MIGLLWYAVKEFNEQQAIAAYQRRLHNLPNMVYCQQAIECKKLQVKVVDNIPSKHYFLVREELNVTQEKT